MNPTWIARRFVLARTPQQLGDEHGVVPPEVLGVVRQASELTRAVRDRCAHQLRSVRARQRERSRQQRLQCEARVLADVAALTRALKEERQDLRDSAASLAAQVARDALKRLMVDVPQAWPVQSSVQLVLTEWAALDLKDEAVLRVHPDDLPLLTPPAEGQAWSLSADTQVARGSCVLTHSAGSVQADFRANVEALHAALVACDAAPTPDTPSEAETLPPSSTASPPHPAVAAAGDPP